MSDYILLELIERLGNLLRYENRRAGSEFGLLPVHIQILDYLNKCNKYSNTPIGVSKYFRITKGTISQSLKILERKDLIFKYFNSGDKRSVHIGLTLKGRNLLAIISSGSVVNELLKSLPVSTLRVTIEGLRKLLRKLQTINNHNTFGVCKTCKHLISGKGYNYKCGLTGESLTKGDTAKICHEHQYSEAVNS